MRKNIHRFHFLCLAGALLCFLFFPNPVWAQDEPRNWKSIEQELVRLQNIQPKLTQFMKGMVERKINAEFLFAMEKRGFNEAEIKEVFVSPEYAGFLRYVVSHRKVEKAIDDYLHRALSPEVVRKRLLKQQREALFAQATNRQLMIQKAFLEKRRVFEDAKSQKKPSFLTRLWSWFGGLLGGRA